MPEPAERRSLIIVGVLTVVSVITGLVIWRTWGPHVNNQPQFKLAAKHIFIPPQPDWIVEDVRGRGDSRRWPRGAASHRRRAGGKGRIGIWTSDLGGESESDSQEPRPEGGD